MRWCAIMPSSAVAVETHAAGLVLQRAAEAVDQRALAGAVRPDQPEPLAGCDRADDVVERDKAAETFAEAADSQRSPAWQHRSVASTRVPAAAAIRRRRLPAADAVPAPARRCRSAR